MAFDMSGFALSRIVTACGWHVTHRTHDRQAVSGAGHMQVTQQHVEVLAQNVLQCFQRIPSRRHLKPVRLQDPRQPGKDRLVVVNKQQLRECQVINPMRGLHT